MHRTFSLLLVALLAVSALSFMIAEPTSVQSMPTPSVPEFNVKYIDYITNIEPTTSTNPYTGQNVTISSGSASYNETVVFTIKNQPFTPHKDSNGNYIGIYFNFRYKGHYEDQWAYMPFNPNGITASPWNGWTFSRGSLPYFPQSNSDDTTFVFALTDFVPFGTNSGQLDFGLQAQIGYITDIGGGSFSLGSYYNFTGESSDWSNTQTITIDYNSNSSVSTTSPNTPSTATSTSAAPEIPALAIVPLLLSMFSVAVIVRHRKPTNQQT